MAFSYFEKELKDKDNLVIVSPDAGGMHRAKAFCDTFNKNSYPNVQLAFINKERVVEN